MIYFDLVLATIVVVYVVDCSGFTLSWRGALARILRVREDQLRPLKPFDCSTCLVWWTGVAVLLVQRQFSFLTLAFVAVLSLLAFPLSQFMLFIREGLLVLIDRMQRWIQR